MNKKDYTTWSNAVTDTCMILACRQVFNSLTELL